MENKGRWMGVWRTSNKPVPPKYTIINSLTIHLTDFDFQFLQKQLAFSEFRLMYKNYKRILI